MIIISDTTPLISLMKISQLKLLKEMFGEILISEAVFDELTTNDSFKTEAEQIKSCKFIKKVKVKEEKAVNILIRT